MLAAVEVPRLLLCWLQKRPVSQSCIFILWATRHAAEKPFLAYRCCPFVPPSISITKTLFSHRLGSLTQPLLQIPGSHGEWETRGWQSFSFPLQKDALLVLRRGQLWSRCCDASLALVYSRGHPKQWSKREEGGTYSHPSLCEQHSNCYRQHRETMNMSFLNSPPFLICHTDKNDEQQL